MRREDGAASRPGAQAGAGAEPGQDLSGECMMRFANARVSSPRLFRRYGLSVVPLESHDKARVGCRRFERSSLPHP
eukprot:1383150-Amorphochlora_amoeboformis.AAC.1